MVEVEVLLLGAHVVVIRIIVTTQRRRHLPLKCAHLLLVVAQKAVVTPRRQVNVESAPPVELDPFLAIRMHRLNRVKSRVDGRDHPSRDMVETLIVLIIITIMDALPRFHVIDRVLELVRDRQVSLE